MTSDYQIQQLFKYATAKDLPTTLALFTEDAIFEDPHYSPTRVNYKAHLNNGISS